MKSWTLLVAAIVVGIVAVLAPLGFYWLGGGFTGPFSSIASDWGDFGSYFGGVLAPIMSFGSIVLLVVTLVQQETRAAKNTIRQDLLRYLEALYEDIRFLMQRKLRDHRNEFVDFGDYVFGVAAHPPMHDDLFRAMVRTLLVFVAEYSEAVALYRANIHAHFDLKAHRLRLKHLLEFLEENRDLLEGTEGVTLGFIRLHFEGRSGDRTARPAT